MKALATKTAWKLLKTLLEDPLSEFKEIELIKKAKTGKGAASNCLHNLVKEHLLQEKKVGKAKIYSLNLCNPLFFFIKNFLDQEKIKKLSDNKKAAVFFFKQKIQDKAPLLIIFGSTIAGTATKESDIDFLVVSKDSKFIEKARKEAEELFGERLNLHYHSAKEIKQKVRTDFFTKNALTKGVILLGQDLGKELLTNLQEKKDTERLLFFLERIKAASRNYQQKDYTAAKEIIEKTLEQLVYYLLSEKGVPYTSKKDALESINQLPEGKTLQKINKSALKEKIKLSKNLLTEKLQQTIIQGEGYA